MSEPAALELKSFLPYRLSVLANRVSAAIAADYAERFDLTIPEWRVMAVLARFPGLSAAEVAGFTAMDKVAVSRAVARLIAARRLLRATAPEDRRRSVLRLSPAGDRIYRQIVPLALRHESRLAGALSEGERRDLDRLLDKLAAAAAADLAESGA
jgi:DNA-binding MarR family transcriptional regulator